MSYPDGIETADGQIYVIYGYNRYDDREVFMAVFTEEDIAAGDFVSPQARQRVLVNKATGKKAE